MTEDWKPYLCNANGSLASILVNLGLRDVAPITAKPWLLWIWVYFNTPRADGLSDSKEAPTLFEIEDALSPQLSKTCSAILCGRITTKGPREFYFYGATGEGFHQAVEAVMTGFDSYKFDIGKQEDSKWNQYLNVLYPSEEDLQRITNMDLLDALVEKGDILTVAREVNHWVYLPSSSSRAQFRESAKSIGFSIVSEFPAEGDLQFGIIVARTQSIEQSSIDKTVLELLELARQCDGDYDGWETPVVNQ